MTLADFFESKINKRGKFSFIIPFTRKEFFQNGHTTDIQHH